MRRSAAIRMSARLAVLSASLMGLQYQTVSRQTVSRQTAHLASTTTARSGLGSSASGVRASRISERCNVSTDTYRRWHLKVVDIGKIQAGVEAEDADAGRWDGVAAVAEVAVQLGRAHPAQQRDVGPRGAVQDQRQRHAHTNSQPCLSAQNTVRLC